jgi:hypothetical protein
MGYWGYWHTYINHSELQVITVLLLISTIHRSSQHTLSHFPACYVFNRRFLAATSNSGDSPASRAHDVAVRRISRNWTIISCQLNYSAISSEPLLLSLTQLPALNWTGQSSEPELLYDWRFTANQFVLATSPRDPRQEFLFSNWTLAVIVLTQHPLWRDDGSVVYSCCWSSPAQSFSGPSPAGLMTTFYCLRFETPPTWWARVPKLYPRHLVLFSSPPTTRRATVGVLDHWTSQLNCLQENSAVRTSSKAPFFVVCVFVSAGTCLPNRCSETGSITPLFYYCVIVCCGRYLATATVYRVSV